MPGFKITHYTNFAEKIQMNQKFLLFAALLLCSMVFCQQKINIPVTVSVQPFSYNQINFASGFSNPNNATADLFGKNGKTDFSIPSNYMGSQDAFEGDYYFGIITYKGDRIVDLDNIGGNGFTIGKTVDYRYSEYVQINIPQALSTGKEYEFVFKISLADNSAFATKGFGVYFSEKQLSDPGNKMLDLIPQVTYSDLVTDKSGWTELKAKFKAVGTEKFAVIGCFSNGYEVKSIGGGKGYGSVRSYYYVSSISINETSKPDKDKDGIADELDSCPDVAGVEKFNGCPDSDSDGIEDKLDVCPTLAGLEKYKGCPDSDNDGLPDNKDKCPTVFGPLNNSGCPEVKINSKAKEVFQKAMTGIQFETGKDVIKKTSFPVLDNVATVLKENPSWNVEVQGHTDNAGKYESNKLLSEKRAIAVKNYLTGKGISSDKLSASGYGSDMPIADNKTAAGKAKNRRVEFKVNYVQ